MVRLKVLSQLLICFAVCQALSTTTSAAPQRDAPLTLSQLEDFIKHQTPDSAIAIEIRKRGIAFQLSSKILADLKELGAGPITTQALIARLSARRTNRKGAQKAPHDRFTILVADFKSLSEQNFGVTEKIIQRLRLATNEYPEVSIQALGQTITEQQGSDVARKIGQERRARIVLWGYYNAPQGSNSSDNAEVVVYFEVLSKPKT